MFAALFLSLLAAGPGSASVPRNDPPIELWINNDRRFLPGDAAKVHIQSKEDGYVVVLHADPDGRVRVLFPLDPHDDNFVRGGKRYEVRGRGDREAFEASIAGRGMVYAAVSRDPFHFDRYIVGDHWDYRALAPERLPREPEAELTELVRGMAQSSFDYDVLTYDVIERVYASNYSYPPVYRYWNANAFCDPFYYNYYCQPYYGSFLSIRLAFGRPYRYAYNPFFYDPFFYRPTFVYPHRLYVHNSRFDGRFPIYGRFPALGLNRDNYRDRRYTFRQIDGYRSPLVSLRRPLVATPTRRAVARVEDRPEPRSVQSTVEQRRPTPTNRPTIEARRARTVESRPNVESRPMSREPGARRIERGRDQDVSPQAESQRRADSDRSDGRGMERRGGRGAQHSHSWGGRDGGGGRRR